ncbi:MAG: cupin domain-containing protein [Cypionkella sp.]
MTQSVTQIVTQPAAHLARLCRDGITPEVNRPAPEKIIAGDPVHTTWNVEERGTLYAGLWHSTQGEWRVSYDEWEYVHILEGVSVLTDAQGLQTRLQAGDSFLIRPGFAGSWRVLEPTLKDYVILG